MSDSPEDGPDFGDPNAFMTAKPTGIPPTKALRGDTFKRSNSGRGIKSAVELSKEDLLRLLGYLEGELQGRDVAIATLKQEAAKQLLYQAKYGRLGLNDPLAALQRDSAMLGSQADFDEASISGMYESQLVSLEKLITVQRKAHQRAKQTLAAAERRHARTIRELESEKARNAADAAQGDDVCALLEKERERLGSQLEHAREEQGRLDAELEKGALRLEEEKARHKAIVLHLLNDRKTLITRLAEATRAAKGDAPESSDAPSPTPFPAPQPTSSPPSTSDKSLEKRLKELEAEVGRLSTDKARLSDDLGREKEETASLREIVRTQEEDLSLIRQNILAKTRQMNAKVTSPEGPAPRLPPTTTTSAAGPSRPPGATDTSAGATRPRPSATTHVQVASPLRPAPRPATSRILSNPLAARNPSPFPVSPEDMSATRPPPSKDRRNAPPPAYAGSPAAERSTRGNGPAPSASSSRPKTSQEPEIGQLEAVISSMDAKKNGAPGLAEAGSTPMPPRKVVNGNSLLSRLHRQRSSPSPARGLTAPRAASASRRASNPEPQIEPPILSKRHATPVPAFRAPLPPAYSPDAEGTANTTTMGNTTNLGNTKTVGKASVKAGTGTIKRNPLVAAVGKAMPGRVRKKATQV